MSEPVSFLSRYLRLVGEGEKEFSVVLDEQQRSAILALYDNGVAALSDNRVADALNALSGQLKDQIWP